jgi:2-polyprenyl-3-methyl-5-hydroxy-6-metoxy-1,4-benzoquinol methylase
MDQISKKFISLNKDYYKYIEDYDWISVTDHFKGLESFFHKFREAFVLRLISKNKRGDKFLDAGCGAGLILRHLPKDSVGVDINPRNITRAKKYAPKAILKLADIEKLPFKAGEFSTIVCTEVIEHQPDPTKTIAELKWVLQKKGVIIGSVPSNMPIWGLRFLSSTCPRGEPFHKNFKKYELEKIFSGFKILKLNLSVFGMSYFFVLEK